MSIHNLGFYELTESLNQTFTLSFNLFALADFFRTAIGIRGKDGIVFGVEKLVTSKLYEAGANKRIFNIDKHIGMVSIQFCSTIKKTYNYSDT